VSAEDLGTEGSEGPRRDSRNIGQSAKKLRTCEKLGWEVISIFVSEIENLL
jgi:hypothetical protein